MFRMVGVRPCNHGEVDRVTWFKVDDGFWSHPKTATLSDAAVTLWVRAGAYSCQHLTDGVISRPVLRLVGTPDAAEELVAARLWLEDAEGWRFHDWDHYQPTKADVEAERAAARERMRERRRNKKGRFEGSSPEQPANVPEKFGVRSSTPTRPDPTRPSISNEIDEKPRKRGTRIPEPFMLTNDMREWAAIETPTVDIDAATRRFVDYWRAETGAKATKLDWVATWRNWLRRDADNKRPNLLTPTERARQTAAAGRNVAGVRITSLDPKELEG